jgi:hypothetical protein
MDRKEYKRIKQRQYYNDNREKVLERQTQYRLNNPDRVKIAKAKWILSNPEKNKESKIKYVKNNPDKIRLSVKTSVNKRKEIDILFKIKCKLKMIVCNAVKRNGYLKKSNSVDILGCSYIELIDYLESKWEPWMTWDNKGLYNGAEKYGWDVDHIIPLSSAKTEDELLKLCHYTNLQPLCSYINRRIKGDVIIT